MSTPLPTPASIATPVSSCNTSANNPTVQSQLQSHAVYLSQLVARNVFNIAALYPPPLDVLICLALMKCKASPLNPSSILFVHPIGGGIHSYGEYIPHCSVGSP